MELRKVLLLTPHSKLADKIESAFLRAEFGVVRTDRPEDMLGLLREEQPNAMIVDWDLANGTVEMLADAIRENCMKTGLVLLSRGQKAEERIRALEDGADDCIVQTPEVDELVAKVKALIRRIDLVDHAPRELTIKDISINLDTHEVRQGSRLLDMTYTQFKLLYLLASRRDYVFSRDEILKKVWGENACVTTRTVDVHVKRLREKLGGKSGPSQYILTIHGLGYQFV